MQILVPNDRCHQLEYAVHFDLNLLLSKLSSARVQADKLESPARPAFVVNLVCYLTGPINISGLSETVRPKGDNSSFITLRQRA
jgi:hypothetical protein